MLPFKVDPFQTIARKIVVIPAFFSDWGERGEGGGERRHTRAGKAWGGEAFSPLRPVEAQLFLRHQRPRLLLRLRPLRHPRRNSFPASDLTHDAGDGGERKGGGKILCLLRGRGRELTSSDVVRPTSPVPAGRGSQSSAPAPA